MATYALLNTQSGAIVRREDFTGNPPNLHANKKLRWISDTVPSFNPKTQRIVVPTTLPTNATSVTYTVESLPDDIISQSIRDEAYRRIIKIFATNSRDGEAKQRNLIAQATQLLRVGEANWTTEQAAAWSAGQALWDRVAALRADSNALEAAWDGMNATQRAAFDVSDNAHWSE